MIVNIKKTQRVYNGFLKIDKAELQYEKFDGSLSSHVIRENCNRGDATAMLLYDLKNNKVVLIKQFRYPVFCTDKNNAWTLELPAGNIEHRENPLIAIKRELLEEVKLNIDESEIKCIFEIFPSPGGTSERIFIYAAQTDLSRLPDFGGLASENEDIAILSFSIQKAFQMMDANEIKDAKTVIALQWLKLNC